MVEHLPHYSAVEGSSQATAAAALIEIARNKINLMCILKRIVNSLLLLYNELDRLKIFN